MLVLSLWRGGLNRSRAGSASPLPAGRAVRRRLLFILLVLLHYSTVISKLSDQNTILAQRLAMLEAKMRERGG